MFTVSTFMLFTHVLLFLWFHTTWLLELSFAETSLSHFCPTLMITQEAVYMYFQGCWCSQTCSKVNKGHYFCKFMAASSAYSPTLGHFIAWGVQPSCWFAGFRLISSGWGNTKITQCPLLSTVLKVFPSINISSIPWKNFPEMLLWTFVDGAMEDGRAAFLPLVTASSRYLACYSRWRLTQS